MQPKVVGQPCENNCGGKYVQNPKTGKIFCENKCWLNGGQPANQNVPFRTPAENKQGEIEIARGKVRHGFAIEAFKKGMMLDVKTATEINCWTDYVMTGKLSQTMNQDTAQAFEQSEYPQ